MSKAQRATPIVQVPIPNVLKALIDKAIQKHPGRWGSRSDFIRKASFAAAKAALAEQPELDFEAQVAAELKSAAAE